MTFEIQHISPVGMRVNPAFTNVITVTAGGMKRIIIGALDPVDEHGALVGAGDLAAQTEQIFKNLELALSAAGATLTDVVIWRIYVVEGQDLRLGAGVAMRHWGQRPNPPANTVALVSSMGYPGSLVMLEAEAIVPA